VRVSPGKANWTAESGSLDIGCVSVTTAAAPY
jgi:hypothetical protein